jgi:hypothetical protein
MVHPSDVRRLRFTVEFGPGWRVAPWDPSGLTRFAVPGTPPPTVNDMPDMTGWLEGGYITDDTGWVPEPREAPRWPLVTDHWTLGADGVWRLP